MSRAHLLLCVVTLFGVFWNMNGYAADICGSVWSGGRPVPGAQVLASTEGVIATTDDDGKFCLRDLKSDLQMLQILALGFGRLERWVKYEPNADPLRLELIPLRSIGYSGPSSTGKTIEEEPFPPQRDLRRQVSLALAAGDQPDFNMLMFSRDTIWIESPPAGESWKSLLALEKALQRAAPGETDSARYWKEVGAWASELEERLCVEKATLSRTPELLLSPAACSFLLRAQCVSLLRAYLAGGDDVKTSLQSRLDQLLSSQEEGERGWGREILDHLQQAGNWNPSENTDTSQSDRP